MRAAVLFVAVLTGTAGFAAEQVFEQNTAPKKTHIFTSEPKNDPCTLTVFLHGHLTKPFAQDVTGRFGFERQVSQAPGSVVLVPNLMSTCSRSYPCKSKYYDNFSMKQYLESAEAHLKQSGQCASGIAKVSLIGHSGIYSWLERGLLSELTPADCSRPAGILGKVENLVLLDSLFYTNPVSTETYKNFNERVKRCDNGLKFAHMTRTMGGAYAPHRNSCQLSRGSNPPCPLQSEIKLDQATQFLAAAQRHNHHEGHWDLVSDTLPRWLKLFNSASASLEGRSNVRSTPARP